MFKEVIHQIKNRWLLLMLLSTNFTAKCSLAFVLTKENAPKRLLLEVLFDNQQKDLGFLLKIVLAIFKI